MDRVECVKRADFLREQAARLYRTGSEYDADYAAELEIEIGEIEDTLCRPEPDA